MTQTKLCETVSALLFVSDQVQRHLATLNYISKNNFLISDMSNWHRRVMVEVCVLGCDLWVGVFGGNCLDCGGFFGIVDKVGV